MEKQSEWLLFFFPWLLWLPKGTSKGSNVWFLSSERLFNLLLRLHPGASKHRCIGALRAWYGSFFLPNRHGGFLKSWNRGTPESSILIWFNMIFHYKPSILRITHLWMDTPICCIILPHISVRPEDHSEAGGFWVAMVRGNLRVRFVWVDLMMNIRNVCNEPYFGASRSTSLIWHNSNFSWFVEDHSADCNWFPPTPQ